jgi:hypothetical protein
MTQLMNGVFFKSDSKIDAYYINGEVLSDLQDKSILPNAVGNRVELPAYDLMDLSSGNASTSSEMSYFERRFILTRVDNHYMGQVETSLYNQFSVFRKH